MDLFNLALILLLGFAFHCPAMCGPLVSVLYPDLNRAKRFHLGRSVSYTVLGAISGKLGGFAYSSGFTLLATFAVCAILIFLVSQSKAQWLPTRQLSRLVPQPILLGLVFAFIPCHYLWTLFGLAALSGSAWTGGGLLLIHAILSTVSVQGVQRLAIFKKWRQKNSWDRWVFGAAVILLLIRIHSQMPSNGQAPTLICW